MENLATIERITEIKTHPNADALEIAVIKGWNCIIKKGEFSKNDFVIYVQIDTLIPLKEWSKFLFKSESDIAKQEVRLRTIKLRGELSQGLVLPTHILTTTEVLGLGSDVSENLGLKKYVKQIPITMQGLVEGDFPSHLIDRTDEERVQNIPQVLECINPYNIVATEKADGTSATYLHHGAKVYVCSRNLRWKDTDSNIYWKMYKQYELHKFFEGHPMYALQGEIVGYGINGNKLGAPVNEQKFLIFNIWNHQERRYLSWDEKQIVKEFNRHLDFVRQAVFTFPINAPLDVQWCLEQAKGNYLGTSNPREGIVIRTRDENAKFGTQRLSFKVINNDFLLKYGE
jgi:RNA ligase (TIGR02306 family)